MFLPSFNGQRTLERSLATVFLWWMDSGKSFSYKTGPFSVWYVCQAPPLLLNNNKNWRPYLPLPFFLNNGQNRPPSITTPVEENHQQQQQPVSFSPHYLSKTTTYRCVFPYQSYWRTSTTATIINRDHQYRVCGNTTNDFWYKRRNSRNLIKRSCTTSQWRSYWDALLNNLSVALAESRCIEKATESVYHVEIAITVSEDIDKLQNT